MCVLPTLSAQDQPPPPPGADSGKPAGQQGYTLKKDVDLVVLHATVEDSKGAFVPDLKEQNLSLIHIWLSSKQPIEAAATPLPREETTPPVTKMYFGPVRKVSEIPPVRCAYNALCVESWFLSNHDSRTLGFDF